MITSTQNTQIKHLLLLMEKQRERKAHQQFVVEGVKEITTACRYGYKLQKLYACEPLADHTFLQQYPDYIAIEEHVFAKLAYRKTSDGIIALFSVKSHDLELLQPVSSSFYIVLESVEKPGNLGAIARTVDALGADGLLICDPLCDIYNPNVIRSSVGTIFSVPVAVCSSPQCIEFCKNHKITLFAADVSTENLYYTSNFCGSVALVFGTEHDGLSQLWLDNVDYRIKIPMYGQNDSLNVSVSVGILGYEVNRQRENVVM